MKSTKVEYNPLLENIELSNAAIFFERNYSYEYVDMLNWPVKFPYKPQCKFKIARSTKSLFIYFNVTEYNIRAKYKIDHQPVWEDSCVEFFCQLPGQKYYYNFEFNCIGTCLATRRLSRNEDIVPFKSDEMNRIKRFTSFDSKPFEEKSGNFEWKLMVEIPFELIKFEPDFHSKNLNANFYKCGDATSVPHYLSWSHIITENPDFHKPEYFGKLVF
ncbi:MAG: carbohydrate-binding family 9-like protein [Paludibacter sp.]|jgi:hypothetical protein|nr:carbohydrate-binding family 9-like protein [Paludibacter sp.]